VRVKTDAHRREAEGSSGIVYMFSLDVARSPQQSVRSCAATAAGSSDGATTNVATVARARSRRRRHPRTTS
jgi:hypothetical protein